MNGVIAAQTIAVGKSEGSYTKLIIMLFIGNIHAKHLLKLHSYWDASVLWLVYIYSNSESILWLLQKVMTNMQRAYQTKSLSAQKLSPFKETSKL